LQRRIGTIWAKIGWEADCIARANIRVSRTSRPLCLRSFRSFIGMSSLLV
jgi:hypothetical protein